MIKRVLNRITEIKTQPAFNYLESTIETAKQGVKYVRS